MLSSALLSPIQATVASKQLDTEQGLMYLGGNVANYHLMLEKFVKLHTLDAAQLEKLLKQGDNNGAELLAHSLKGIAATLGMEKIRAIALSLEHKLHLGNNSPDHLTTETAELALALAEAITEINMLLAAIKPATPNVIDPEHLKQLLTELQQLLAADDMKAYMMWRQLAGSLTTLIGHQYTVPLGQDIESFDFHQALIKLVAIVDSHPCLSA